MGDRTQGNVLGKYPKLLGPIHAGPMRSWSARVLPNCSPQDVLEERSSSSMPVLKYREPGQFVQIVWKLAAPSGRRSPQNPERDIILWADEAQLHALPTDSGVQAVARKHKLVQVAITQNLAIVVLRLKNRDDAIAWMSNLQTKFMFANGDKETQHFLGPPRTEHPVFEHSKRQHAVRSGGRYAWHPCARQLLCAVSIFCLTCVLKHSPSLARAAVKTSLSWMPTCSRAAGNSAMGRHGSRDRSSKRWDGEIRASRTGKDTYCVEFANLIPARNGGGSVGGEHRAGGRRVAYERPGWRAVRADGHNRGAGGRTAAGMEAERVEIRDRSGGVPKRI